MFKAFFASIKWFPVAYGGFIALLWLQYQQVQVSVMCLDWNKIYGDMMQGSTAYTAEQWFTHLISYKNIAYLFIVYEIFQILGWRLYSLLWRVAVTKSYFPKWLGTKIDVEETPQRLTDGVKELTSTITGLATQFARMGMALYCFLPRLWDFSKDIDLSFVKKINGIPSWAVSLLTSVDGIPGILVWLTLIVGVLCLLVALIISIYIPKFEWANQNNEGALRKSIERVQRTKHDGEDPTRELEQLMDNMQFGYIKTAANQFGSDAWRCVYNQAMVIFPMLLFGGGVVAGTIKFGVLTASAVAFGEVNGVFVTIQNNWLVYTRLWSVIQRISELERNIEERPLDKEAEEKARWPLRDRRNS